MARDFGIVGGGFLGMTLALRLAQAGNSVTLYERADELGGLASAWTIGDVTWDRHYHVTLLSDRHVRGLLAELGLDDEMRWVETKTGAYADGRLHSVSDTMEFLRFPALRLFDKLRLGGTIFYASRIRDWRRLEAITVERWLTRWSGRRTYEKFWRPLLRAKLGDLYRDASAAFIWAVIQRLYAARRSGLKKEMFGYVPGGYATVLARLGEHLTAAGVDVRLGVTVDAVVGKPSGPVVVTPRDEYAHDHVVTTVASPIAARLIEGLDDAERTAMASIPYEGIVCASVLTPAPLDRFYVTNITDEGFPFTGVIEMSALVDPADLGGHGLVYLPRYLASDDPYLGADDDTVRSEFLPALARMYPAFDPDDVDAFRVSRVRYVLPVSTPGYSSRLPAVTTSVPGVSSVSSAHILNGTLNVNETVQLAERVAPLLDAGRHVPAILEGP